MRSGVGVASLVFFFVSSRVRGFSGLFFRGLDGRAGVVVEVGFSV